MVIIVKQLRKDLNSVTQPFVKTEDSARTWLMVFGVTALLDSTEASEF